MSKNKSFNMGFFNILKCCLIGVIITLVGTVILAVVLKFTDLNSNVINYVNDAIKAVAILCILICIKKSNPNGLLFKSIIASLIFTILCFIIFSILNGAVVLDLSIVFDLLFAVAVAVIESVVLNLVGKN